MLNTEVVPLLQMLRGTMSSSGWEIKRSLYFYQCPLGQLYMGAACTFQVFRLIKRAPGSHHDHFLFWAVIFPLNAVSFLYGASETFFERLLGFSAKDS